MFYFAAHHYMCSIGATLTTSIAIFIYTRREHLHIASDLSPIRVEKYTLQQYDVNFYYFVTAIVHRRTV